MPRKRVFLSYKRQVDPDETITHQIYDSLSQEHDVFIDTTLGVGVPWAERIESEIRQSDYFIIILSNHSVNSEMVIGEIERAHEWAKVQGHPVILPVRLAYQEPFKYPLNAYLNSINWASWDKPSDTQKLIAKLQAAITQGALVEDKKSSVSTHSSETSFPPEPLPAAQPVLEMPEGTIDANSAFYITRQADMEALELIDRRGVTFTIKGSRQIGKSSLLMRTIQQANVRGKRVVFLDFQRLEKSVIANPDVFYHRFMLNIARKLDMKHVVEENWDPVFGNNEACTDGMFAILKNLNTPLMLAIDEVDNIFGAPYQSDFFGMLRSWHNERALQATWKLLDLVMVISTDPYLLIDNPHQSPFNVGARIDLEDFTFDEVASLNDLHGNPPPLSEEQLYALMTLVEGHPYLIRKALYWVTTGKATFEELMTKAPHTDGPFRDHLNYHLFRLLGHQELIDGLRQIVTYHSCSDRTILLRLQGAGLVKEAGHDILPRCELYARFFGEYLYG